MEERSNKTVMCSVLFLDIVEYSKRSVSGQISLKDRFNSYLSAAISDMPVADRIILDTGDGAAINFLGDVEDALKAALRLRESILNEGPEMDPPLLIRAGINLGPVRLVRDINGQPNIVGDGINVAQRVMGFADVDQILVSRSYYDAVSRLSSQYTGMFSYQGSRTDKHVREHEVYAIGHLGDKTAEMIATSLHAAQKTGLSEYIMTSVRDNWNAMASGLDSAIRNFKSSFEQADRRQRAIYIGVFSVFVVLIGVLAITLGSRDRLAVSPNAESPLAASGIQQAPGVASVAPGESRAAKTSPPQSVIASRPDTKKMTESKPVPKKAVDSKADNKSISGQTKQADAQPKSPVAESADKKSWFEGITSGDAEQQQVADARITVRCNPGTEVFVDGVTKGKIVSGVLTINISSGNHRVIVTSVKGEIYTQQIELRAGKTASIRPGFCD